MRYMGGKYRLSKYLLPIILKDREEGQPYYDICCGAGNMSTGIPGKVTAVDNHYYVIEALKLIRDHPTALPKNAGEFTKEDFNTYKKYLKEGKEYLIHPGIFGYIGFVASYAGRWYNTWASSGVTDNSISTNSIPSNTISTNSIPTKSKSRDFIAEGYRNAQKQSPRIQNVHYIAADFDSIEIEEESIVYIDPPYRDTTGYSTKKTAFPYEYFYKWCKWLKNKKKCRVFISEYKTPFTPIWYKEVPKNTSRLKTSRTTEVLWVVE